MGVPNVMVMDIILVLHRIYVQLIMSLTVAFGIGYNLQALLHLIHINLKYI